MRRMMIALMSLLPLTSAAVASGGIGCEGSAGKMRFSIESGVTRGMGNPVFQFKGTIATSDKAIQPDLRKVEVTDEHLAQYWLDGKELKMVVYREREAGDHGYVQLTMITRAKEEGTYAGRFDVSYFESKDIAAPEGKTIEVSGKVNCFVE